MRAAFAIAATLAVAAGAAWAEDAPKAMLGRWDLGGVTEGSESCRIVLKADASIGGWVVDRARDCARKFPFTTGINAWHMGRDGKLVFTDALRKPLLSFEHTDDGSYMGGDDSAPSGILMIDRPVTGPAPTRQDQMSGDWSIGGVGGAPHCAVVSHATVAATSGTLTVKPGCDRKLARGWASWKLKGEILTLFDAKGTALQTFKRGDIVTFEGEDAKGDSIYFSRD